MCSRVNGVRFPLFDRDGDYYRFGGEAQVSRLWGVSRGVSGHCKNSAFLLSDRDSQNTQNFEKESDEFLGHFRFGRHNIYDGVPFLLLFELLC